MINFKIFEVFDQNFRTVAYNIIKHSDNCNNPLDLIN